VNAWLTTTLAAAMAVAVIAMGCGSDEDSGSASAGDSSSLSKAEFVKQANAACLKPRETALQEVAAYSQKHRSEGLSDTLLGRKAIKVVLLKTFEEEIAALRALGAPEGDEEEIDAMLAATQSALDEAKELPKTSSKEVESYFGDADKKLRQYGLTGCTKVSG
jgi:hypothetical protein